MDDRELELEKKTIKEEVAEARRVADALERHEKENKRLWIALLCSLGATLIMAVSAVWAVSHAQQIANEAVLNALNSVAEIGVTQETTTSTETTTVTQDTGEGPGNNVYLQENGTYNESGAE